MPRLIRNGFTLIELLVVVAILGTMVTIGVVSVQSGQDVSRMKGAMRDVYATIRHARSLALVIGRPVRVTYATEKLGDETAVKVEVKLEGGDKLMSERSSDRIENYWVRNYRELSSSTVAATTAADGEKEGETLEDVLLAGMDQSVLKGLRIKVEMSETLDYDETEVQRQNRISIGSNASGSYETRELGTETPTPSTLDEDEPDDAPVSVVWQTNGLSEPHVIWVYRDGTKPEDGLVLKVDRYGGIKILEGKDLLD